MAVREMLRQTPPLSVPISVPKNYQQEVSGASAITEPPLSQDATAQPLSANPSPLLTEQMSRRILILTGPMDYRLSQTEYLAARRRPSEEYVGTLPLPAEELYRAKGLPLGNLGGKVEGVAQANLRILIVDDEEKWRKEISGLLRLQGHTVDVAINITEGKNSLETMQYDGAIFDGLEGGWEELYKLATAMRIPAYVLSAKSLEGQVEQGRFRAKGTLSTKIVLSLFPIAKGNDPADQPSNQAQ